MSANTEEITKRLNRAKQKGFITHATASGRPPESVRKLHADYVKQDAARARRAERLIEEVKKSFA